MTKFLFAPLSPVWGDYLGAFDCGDLDLNSFLVEDATRLERERVARTTLAVQPDSGEILGYVTVLNDAVRLLTRERKRLGLASQDHPVIPALKIARLGVAEGTTHRGIGTALVRDSYFAAQESAASGGCRLLTVDAYPTALPFYEKLGFEKNRSPEYQSRENPSLRFDVFSPKLPSWI